MIFWIKTISLIGLFTASYGAPSINWYSITFASFAFLVYTLCVIDQYNEGKKLDKELGR